MDTRTTIEIKSWSSPDIDVGAWSPTALADVYFLLEIEVGAVDSDAASIYQVLVATPEGLRARASSTLISDRATIIISDYSWQSLHRELIRIVELCNAESLDEATLRLQRYFQWEYEDFVQESVK